MKWQHRIKALSAICICYMFCNIIASSGCPLKKTSCFDGKPVNIMLSKWQFHICKANTNVGLDVINNHLFRCFMNITEKDMWEALELTHDITFCMGCDNKANVFWKILFRKNRLGIHHGVWVEHCYNFLTCFRLMSDQTVSSCHTSFFPHVITCLILITYSFPPHRSHALTMHNPYGYHEPFTYIHSSLVSCTLVYSLFDTQSKEPQKTSKPSEGLLSPSTCWTLKLLN